MEELLEESQRIAGLGSWEWDVATGRVLWSDELFRIFGLEPGSLAPTLEAYLERVHPGDRARVRATVEEALRQGTSFDHLERITRADGRERILHSRGRVTCAADGRLRMVGTCHDVTELRRAEEEKHAASARIARLLERVSDGFVSLDAEWRYTHVNEKAAALLGRSAEALIGKHIWTEFPEGVGQPFYHAYQRAMREQTPVRLEEYYAPWKRWFENRIYPSKDGLSIFFQDITERRRAEEALRRSEVRFREIAESITEVFWIVSPDLRTLHYASPAFELVFGRPPSLEAWLNALHPDDRDGVIQGFLEGRLEGCHRIVRGDGEIRWIRWKGFPVRDDQGRVLRVTGYSEDVTDLKETEEALRRAQTQLAEALHLSEDRVEWLEEQVRSRASFERLVGKSAPMQEVYRKLRLAAQSDVTVLLTGESGTGKELAALAIHSLGARKARPFVAVNCSAIPEALLESELFGHVKGAFTGAVKDKAGLFQAADGGTLFLDEVGDMSPALQVKVLRALQEREIRRVGDERTSKVDVRLLAATNRDLEALVASGRLREDFYYRIRVFDILLPPLRERRDDIPLLVRHFLGQGRSVDGEALSALMNHGWPGNVRELQNAMEHAKVTAAGAPIKLAHLPAAIRGPGALAPELLAERERTRAALREAGGNRTRAAAALGVSRVTLWKKMRRLGLNA